MGLGLGLGLRLGLGLELRPLRLEHGGGRLLERASDLDEPRAVRTSAVGGRRGERGELGRDAKLQLRAVVVLLGRAHEVDAERRGHLVRGTVGVGGRVRVRVRA